MKKTNIHSATRTVIQAALALALHQHFVIDSKLALGHTTEVALHDNPPGHVGAQHLTWVLEQFHIN